MGLKRKLDAEKQGVVRNWLRGLNPACEEIWLSYCRLADADEYPGRARLIGHCIREMRVRILAQFVGEQQERIDYARELLAIEQQLTTGGSTTLDPAANAETPSSAPSSEASALKMLKELIGKSRAKSVSLLDQFTELLRQIRLEPDGDATNLKRIAADFKATTETHGIAHTSKTDADLIDDEFAERLARFEDYLHTFATARHFVARLGTLDDILDEANRSAS